MICDHKIDGDQWLDTARTAHKIGLKSNATMLYGHIENEEDRADHLIRLRTLQDETHGFQTFIPLAFHPANTPLQHLFTTTGMLDIKQIAISRLVLDNFPHIKAYWQMLSPKIAQISLRFGADDIDGTVIEEKIYHDAGATTPQGMVRKELERLIREAGREPVERDTMYRPVTRTETSFTISVLVCFSRAKRGKSCYLLLVFTKKKITRLSSRRIFRLLGFFQIDLRIHERWPQANRFVKVFNRAVIIAFFEILDSPRIKRKSIVRLRTNQLVQVRNALVGVL